MNKGYRGRAGAAKGPAWVEHARSSYKWATEISPVKSLKDMTPEEQAEMRKLYEKKVKK